MQMTAGDCESKEPKKFQFKKHHKWEAWHDLKGMDKKEAGKKWQDLCKDIFPENVNKEIKSVLMEAVMKYKK